MPLAAEAAEPEERKAPLHEDAEELRLERERTTTLPRIESAIPSEPDPSVEGPYGRERLPHTRVFVVAAVASLLIVGGATLAITHPWDPSLLDPRATTPADTSQAGFPGTVSRLQGQDSGVVDASSVASADELTFNAMTDAYDQLAKISEHADSSAEKLSDVGTSGTADERKSGFEDAKQLALDASNLVRAIDAIDVSTTGTYTDQRDHLNVLANWLRNRSDAISKAWSLSAGSSDPERDASKIEAPLKGQSVNDTESYAALFAKNYDAWRPIRMPNV